LISKSTHHEVATGGQTEFGMRFNTLLKTGCISLVDDVQICAKNVALPEWLHRHLHAQTSFSRITASGMHVHQSLWKGDTNKFFDAKGYGHDQPAV